MFKVSHILIVLLFYLLNSLSGLQAQNAFTSAGYNAAGTGGSVSYSVGQILCASHSGANGSLATGVHQPYEISVGTGIDSDMRIVIELSVYPNPTTNNLVLRVEKDNLNDLSYKMFDMQGYFLKGEKLTDQYNNISMSNFLPAMYFLEVFEGQRKLKTFKIIKN